MTLRLRLTLFYTLLVAFILIISGVSVHLLMARSLSQRLDESLLQAGSLLTSFIIDDYDIGEDPSLQQDLQSSRRLVSSLSAILLTQEGKVLDRLGEMPEDVQTTVADGFSTVGRWRIWSGQVLSYKLMIVKEKEAAFSGLRLFDLSFLFFAPVAALAAFVLSYLFAGLALKPLDQMTRAAYDLAQKRAWRESLPEPETEDEVWRLVKATNSLLESLAGLIESEKRFTADAAHELRTPITIFQLRLEKALERAKDETIKEPIYDALEASDDLLALVEQLLVLARAEAGQDLKMESLALDETVFHVSESLRSLFSEKGLALSLDLPEDPVLIEGDSLALELVVRNLLENALKFTSKGKVTVSVYQDSTSAYCEISDTGVGIPSDALPHLFERFFQADTRYRQLGSGLGLALVKSIVEWHGAIIKVENTLEGGSKFTVLFPLCLKKVNNPQIVLNKST